MELIPLSTKIKIAAKGLGLSNDHISAVDTLISRFKEDEVFGLVIPEEVTSLATAIGFAQKHKAELRGLIPSEATAIFNKLSASGVGRNALSHGVMSVTKFLKPDERAKLAEALDALASSGFFSERTDFATEEEFISEAIIPWVRDALPTSDYEGIRDSHTDIICRCPYCKEYFVPSK